MILAGLTSAGLDNKALRNNPNVKAFLGMIKHAEGTHGKGDNGYNVLYGGSLFTSYSRHPNKAIRAWGITSTAAGAYQFLYKTWQGVAAKTGVDDFSPESQDIGAIQLLRDAGAIPYIQSGSIEAAINKVKKIWASFPGAGYGQGEKSMPQMLSWYAQELQNSGGSVIDLDSIKKKINSAGLVTAGIDTNKLLIALAAAAGISILINLFTARA